MMSDDDISKQAFSEFAAHVVRSIAMRNANIGQEKVASVIS